MLKNFNADEFLEKDWQQKAALLPKAFNTEDLLDGDDLAGLSLDDLVESRVVIHENNNWQLIHGPFAQSFFSTPPASPWTLLVQAVNEHIPGIDKILDDFSFIPSWRVDDIMASYAVRGAGVGPHFDYYDVFLIQLDGSREWILGEFCDDQTAVKSDTELSILEDMTAKEVFQLHPGDVLYIPARQAHWGTALVDDCLTLSVGFRAPSHRQILSELPDFLSNTISESLFYKDPHENHRRSFNSEILERDIEQLKTILLSLNQSSDQQLAEWLGCFMTESKYPDIIETNPPKLSVTTIIEQQLTLHRNQSTRMAFTALSNDSDLGGTMFINGEPFPFDNSLSKLAHTLCESRQITAEELKSLLETDSAMHWFNQLYQQGYWHVVT